MTNCHQKILSEQSILTKCNFFQSPRIQICQECPHLWETQVKLWRGAGSIYEEYLYFNVFEFHVYLFFTYICIAYIFKFHMYLYFICIWISYVLVLRIKVSYASEFHMYLYLYMDLFLHFYLYSYSILMTNCIWLLHCNVSLYFIEDLKRLHHKMIICASISFSIS